MSDTFGSFEKFFQVATILTPLSNSQEAQVRDYGPYFPITKVYNHTGNEPTTLDKYNVLIITYTV